MADAARDKARQVLHQYGQTYADQAGIRLADQPSPLYRLLVLTTLLSARISAGIAVAAARELFAAGYRTPDAMAQATWQQRVDALGRGHYRRYDERTSTMLGAGAELCRRRWRGDLRRLRAEAGGNAGRARALLTEFPGIGPTGADIFLREVQGVWPEFRPYLDGRAAAAAAKLRLPGSPEALAGLVAPGDLPAFASALVRAGRDGRSPDRRAEPDSSSSRRRAEPNSSSSRRRAEPNRSDSGRDRAEAGTGSRGRAR